MLHNKVNLNSDQKGNKVKDLRFSKAVSYLFHPIIFPLIGTLIYLFTTPRYTSKKTKILLLIVVFVGTYILPIVLLVFLKGLGMIKSFHLTAIEERKFPTLFFSFLAILVGRLFFQIQVVDDLAIFFVSGGLSFLLLYGILWLQIKVSIHTLGIGGLIGFLINLSLVFHHNYLYTIALLFFFFGILANARLKLKAHSFLEVVWGLIIGLLVQLLVPLIYQNI